MKIITLLAAAVLAGLTARADVEVWFLRHGETWWNRAKVLQGHIAHPDLTDRGVAMAEDTAAGFTKAGIVFDRVYSSPLRRTAHTAEIVARGQAIVYDARLQEKGFGSAEGRPFLDREHRSILKATRDGEPVAEVRARVAEFLDRVVRPLDGSAKRVLCVSHGGILGELVEMYAPQDDPARKITLQRNCSVNVLRVTKDAVVMTESNRTFYDVAKYDAMKVEPVSRARIEWRPKKRLCGFNLLGMFSRDNFRNGDKRVDGRFPEEHFRWIHDWGFNYARLPLDYRFFVKDGDWMKYDETALEKLDEAVAFGKKYGVHVNVCFHRAPGYCCNPPMEPKSLFTDPEALAAFTNLWTAVARRYRGIPNDELTFDLVNEPAPVDGYGCTTTNYAAVAMAAVKAIRAVDPHRFIMSDGYYWGSVPVNELHPLPYNAGESIHPYAPHSVTHHGAAFMKLDKVKECPPWPPAGYDSGRRWFLEKYFAAWEPVEGEGCFLHLGEFGTYFKCPHATALAWTEDLLAVAKEKKLGWSIWNLVGGFGIVDSGRTDCELEDFEGHKLDRRMLDLLIRYRD